MGLAEVVKRRFGMPARFYNAHFALLEHLVVDAAYRNRQVGTRLTSKVKRWARSKSLDRMQVGVWERNAGACKLYERHGFRTLNIPDGR